MRNLLLGIVVVLFTGCALVEKVDRIVRPPKFDSAEYSTLIDVRQLLANEDMCDNPTDQLVLALNLQNKIDWAHKYSEYIPRNQESFAMLTVFKGEADRFVEHAQQRANPTYCRLKLENMNEQAIIIQQALGNK